MALDDFTTPEEDRNKRRGMVISMVVHILLLLIALIPLLSYTDPPPGQEGIVVNLGMPDVGQGFENAPPAPPQEVEKAVAEPVEEIVEEEIEEIPPPVEEIVPDPVVETEAKEVVQAEDPEQIALRKQQEEAERLEREEALRKQQERLEQQLQAEQERKRKEAEEEAQRKEEAKRQEEADKLKNEIGDLFGDGAGKGNNSTEGNQGDPEGDPDASRLEGISSGSGRVGGGLSDRGLLAAPPEPVNPKNEKGLVVVRVCVDAGGNVISAEFQQGGSTSNDSDLVEIARKNAFLYKFSKGAVDRQCGTITYNFQLR